MAQAISVEWHPRVRLANANPGAIGGVHLIGHEGKTSDSTWTIYVGQSGDIGGRLDDHQNDEAITKYKERGTLYATWAKVSVSQRDGVERYLADELKPFEGKNHPKVTPIEVNKPKGWV